MQILYTVYKSSPFRSSPSRRRFASLRPSREQSTSLPLVSQRKLSPSAAVASLAAARASLTGKTFLRLLFENLRERERIEGDGGWRLEPRRHPMELRKCSPIVESAAEMLYGLIHARCILTSKGLAAMLEKYKSYDFGRCPRVFSCGQPCLHVGQSDISRSNTVKIYCPKCEDLYYPRSKYQGNIDGAYFGITFAHLFLMTYPHLKPQKASQRYAPRVFGFKIHKP